MTNSKVTWKEPILGTGSLSKNHQKSNRLMILYVGKTLAVVHCRQFISGVQCQARWWRHWHPAAGVPTDRAVAQRCQSSESRCQLPWGHINTVDICRFLLKEWLYLNTTLRLRWRVLTKLRVDWIPNHDPFMRWCPNVSYKIWRRTVVCVSSRPTTRSLAKWWS